MTENSWVKEFPGPVVVCDATGIIIEMNDRAIAWFADRGGRELVGKSLIDVHQEQARAQIRRMMETKENNVYSIEKGGSRFLIYQSPWYREGKFAGLVEFGLEIPADIPHHVRTPRAPGQST